MFKPGDEVWVVERDPEDGEPTEVSGYMFLAQSNDFAICCAEVMHIGDDVDATLDYHAQETREQFATDLSVFPIEDCYRSKENADGAMREELDELEAMEESNG